MKNILIILLAISLASCEKEEIIPKSNLKSTQAAKKIQKLIYKKEINSIQNRKQKKKKFKSLLRLKKLI